MCNNLGQKLKPMLNHHIEKAKEEIKTEESNEKEEDSCKKKVVPPRDETPTKESIIDVSNKGKKAVTPNQLSLKCLMMPLFLNIIPDIKKLEEFKVVNLTEECTAVVLKKLSLKLKDPGCFIIPCTMCNSHFDKASCDLGASITLMPYFIFKKLDRTNNHPHDIVEDIMVKVGKFIFPVDFVILYMEEDDIVPIILGRPFLAIRRRIINALDNSKGDISGNYVRLLYFRTLENPKPYKEPIKKWCEKYKWLHESKLITKV
ncbi:hypothetical protein CR513_32055, partial [Mucuna pruriens]